MSLAGHKGQTFLMIARKMSAPGLPLSLLADGSYGVSVQISKSLF
jgi:hypothetical protein